MTLTSARILVVEDHSDIRLLFTILLRKAGYEVVAAKSYAEGLSLARGTHFDLYLLDHALSDGCGLDLREKLQEIYPATPALFCTGNAYCPNQTEKLRQNGDDYLLKPALPEQITKAVASLLTTSKA